MTASLWLVVPAFNEEQRLGQTLTALASQQDLDFSLIVVDNGSTDRTAALAQDFASVAPFPVVVLTESEPGTGSAVDTGMRFAMDSGADFLARTDADCLPSPTWTREARQALGSGIELAAGKVVARHDEHGLLGRAVFRCLVMLAATFGRVRPANRGRQYRQPYVMHAGNNMAITAGLYQACGGMPRRPSPTDHMFLNRARLHSDHIRRVNTMVVANSSRRLRSYGIVGTARWYLERGDAGQGVNVR